MAVGIAALLGGSIREGINPVSNYETHGFIEEAIHHSLAAGDYSAAARLIEAVAENAWLSGQYNRILTWTKAIPTELIHKRPWLCVWNAWVYTQLGEFLKIERWISAAVQATKNQYGDSSFQPALDASPEAQALLNEIAALRAFMVSFSKDYDQAIELAETVLKNPPLTDKKVASFTRCNLLHVLSSMYFAMVTSSKLSKPARRPSIWRKRWGLRCA